MHSDLDFLFSFVSFAFFACVASGSSSLGACRVGACRRCCIPPGSRRAAASASNPAATTPDPSNSQKTHSSEEGVDLIHILNQTMSHLSSCVCLYSLWRRIRVRLLSCRVWARVSCSSCVGICVRRGPGSGRRLRRRSRPSVGRACRPRRCRYAPRAISTRSCCSGAHPARPSLGSKVQRQTTHTGTI